MLQNIKNTTYVRLNRYKTKGDYFHGLNER